LIQLDKESAVSFARQALQHSQRINYESGIAGAKEMIGMYQASVSDYPGALESFFAFLDIVKKLGDQSAEVRGFLRISGVYMKIRNSQMAYKYVQDAILLANNLQKPDDMGFAHYYLAMFYYEKKELPQAKEWAHHSLSELQELSDQLELVARVEKLIGDISLEELNFKDAIHYYNSSLKGFQETNLHSEEAILLTRIAHVYERTGDQIKGLEILREALFIRDSLGNPELISHSLVNIGKVFLTMHDLDSALIYFTRGLVMAEKSKKASVIEVVYFQLYKYYFAVGNYKKSIDYFSLYTKAHDEAQAERSRSEITLVETRAQLKELETKNALLIKELEIQKLSLKNRSYSELITQLIIGTIGLLLLVLVFIAERSKLSKSRLELINRQLDEEIKERKKKEVRLRKSEQLYRFITDNSLDLIVRMDRNFRYLFISPSVYRMFGYNHMDRLEELPGLDRVIQPEFWPELRQEYRSMIRTGTPLMVTYQATRKDGSTFWAESHVNPIFEDHGGRLKETITVVRDISDRIAYEEVLSENARHKEVLLKEIHHRVKNNYSILISLINMQTLASDPGISRDVLKELQGRIRTMSLVHELLYQSDDVDFVEFNKYLNQLILVISTAFKSKPVSIKTHLESCILNIEIAMPLGLIVNEILTNAFKYAFSTEHKGKLWIDLKLLGDESEFHPTFSHSLSIRDNGPGLPEKFDLETRKSMGSQIIQLLTEQIQGKLVIANNKGASFTVYFRDETD
jgi:PAS domain S-box-containing protein